MRGLLTKRVALAGFQIVVVLYIGLAEQIACFEQAFIFNVLVLELAKCGQQVLDSIIHVPLTEGFLTQVVFAAPDRVIGLDNCFQPYRRIGFWRGARGVFGRSGDP